MAACYGSPDQVQGQAYPQRVPLGGLALPACRYRDRPRQLNQEHPVAGEPHELLTPVRQQGVKVEWLTTSGVRYPRGHNGEHGDRRDRGRLPVSLGVEYLQTAGQ